MIDFTRIARTGRTAALAAILAAAALPATAAAQGTDTSYCTTYASTTFTDIIAKNGDLTVGSGPFIYEGGFKDLFAVQTRFKNVADTAGAFPSLGSRQQKDIWRKARAKDKRKLEQAATRAGEDLDLRYNRAVEDANRNAGEVERITQLNYEEASAQLDALRECKSFSADNAYTAQVTKAAEDFNAAVSGATSAYTTELTGLKQKIDPQLAPLQQALTADRKDCENNPFTNAVGQDDNDKPYSQKAPKKGKSKKAKTAAQKYTERMRKYRAKVEACKQAVAAHYDKELLGLEKVVTAEIEALDTKLENAENAAEIALDKTIDAADQARNDPSLTISYDAALRALDRTRDNQLSLNELARTVKLRALEDFYIDTKRNVEDRYEVDEGFLDEN